MNIAIIGGGVHGLSTAWKAASRGHKVTLFEQHPFGHQYGSSKGRSRIVRQAYPEPFFTKILLEGHKLWREFEAELGEQIYFPVGLLYFGDADNPVVQSCLSSLNELEVPHEVLNTDQVKARWQNPILDPEDAGIFTPDAGWVAADRALIGLRNLAERQGAVMVQMQVSSLESLTSFDRIIITAGPWITDFAKVKVEVSVQTFAYFEGLYRGPVWIEAGENGLYGFPTEPGATSFKAGVHMPGRVIEPENLDRTPDEWALDILRDLATRRFGVKNPRIVESGACPYTKTENDDFQIFWLNEKTLAASPCSGHGFKFGPWMGEFLTDLLEEKQDLVNFERFAIKSS